MILIRRIVCILFLASWICGFVAIAKAASPLGIAPAALSQAESLQAVIDRGGPLVYVPKGTYTTDKTIKLRSNLALACEEGTVIEAAAGAFLAVHEPESCLVAIAGCENVSINGCTFRMRKADYGTYKVKADGTYDLSPNALGYVAGEWRHAIYIAGSTNVSLTGVTAANSGGDGLMIASVITATGKTPSRDVRVRRCNFTDNYRQGVSVVSCLGDCVVEDSIFSGTKGASPQAGIDIEPEAGDTAEITVRRCQSIGNRGPGYMVGLFKSANDIAPSKIIFQDCTWAAVPNDQVYFRLGGLLKSQVPNGYLMDYLPAGTSVQWNDLIWRK